MTVEFPGIMSEQHSLVQLTQKLQDAAIKRKNLRSLLQSQYSNRVTTQSTQRDVNFQLSVSCLGNRLKTTGYRNRATANMFPRGQEPSLKYDGQAESTGLFTSTFDVSSQSSHFKTTKHKEGLDYANQSNNQNRRPGAMHFETASTGDYGLLQLQRE